MHPPPHMPQYSVTDFSKSRQDKTAAAGGAHASAAAQKASAAGGGAHVSVASQEAAKVPLLPVVPVEGYVPVPSTGVCVCVCVCVCAFVAGCARVSSCNHPSPYTHTNLPPRARAHTHS